MRENDDQISVSLYNGEEASPSDVATAMKRLKTAFPKMENIFFNLLTERIISNGFSGERLKDAVNDIIDNFHYKELNVSDVLKFDRRVRLYSYKEVCALIFKGIADFNDFEIRELDGVCYRVRKTDLIYGDRR